AAVDPTGRLRAEKAAQQAATMEATSRPSSPVVETSGPAGTSTTQTASVPTPASPLRERPLSSPAPMAIADVTSSTSVRWSRIVGWSWGAVALAGVGVTTWLVLDAQHIDSQATDAGVNHQASNRLELEDRAASERHRATIVGIGSGVVLATGLVL